MEQRADGAEVMDTPRTDAIRMTERGVTGLLQDHRDLARQLERENRELLEALKEICELVRQLHYDGEDSESMERAEKLHWVQQARAAIAKAEGK